MSDHLKKTFVVDTNVLLHNPDAIFLFAEHEVVIPFDVIEELDKFKSTTDDLGRNARALIRHLDRLRDTGQLADGVPIGNQGGRLRVILEEGHALAAGLTADTADNRIISCAKELQKKGERVHFVTKDMNARLKSDAIGLPAEDFENQKVDFERLYTGWREFASSSKVIDKLFTEKQARIDAPDLVANEFVLLKDQMDASHTALARYRADLGALVPVRQRRAAVFGIMPRN